MKYTEYLYKIGYNHPIPSGVYALVHVPTLKLYVGSTKDFTHRATQHFKALEEGIHHNRELQMLWDTSSPSEFSFIILERLPVYYRLEEAEQRWLNRLKDRAINRQWKVKRPEPLQIGEVDYPLPWEEV